MASRDGPTLSSPACVPCVTTHSCSWRPFASRADFHQEELHLQLDPQLPLGSHKTHSWEWQLQLKQPHLVPHSSASSFPFPSSSPCLAPGSRDGSYQTQSRLKRTISDPTILPPWPSSRAQVSSAASLRSFLPQPQEISPTFLTRNFPLPHGASRPGEGAKPSSGTSSCLERP